MLKHELAAEEFLMTGSRGVLYTSGAGAQIPCRESVGHRNTFFTEIPSFSSIIMVRHEHRWDAYGRPL